MDEYIRPWKGYYLTGYGLAVKHGFKGTEEEWLLSLHGENAYELAKEKGFIGTEEEWLLSLHGETGDAGVYIGPDEPTDDKVRVWIDTREVTSLDDVWAILNRLRYRDGDVEVDVSDLVKRTGDEMVLYDEADAVADLGGAALPAGTFLGMGIGDADVILYMKDGDSITIYTFDKATHEIEGAASYDYAGILNHARAHIPEGATYDGYAIKANGGAGGTFTAEITAYYHLTPGGRVYSDVYEYQPEDEEAYYMPFDIGTGIYRVAAMYDAAIITDTDYTGTGTGTVLVYSDRGTPEASDGIDIYTFEEKERVTIPASSGFIPTDMAGVLFPRSSGGAAAVMTRLGHKTVIWTAETNGMPQTVTNIGNAWYIGDKSGSITKIESGETAWTTVLDFTDEDMLAIRADGDMVTVIYSDGMAVLRDTDGEIESRAVTEAEMDFAAIDEKRFYLVTGGRIKEAAAARRVKLGRGL